MTKRIFALIVSLAILFCFANCLTVSAQSIETLYYYEQLSSDEKVVYDTLKSIVVSGSKGKEVPALSGVQYTFTASSNITSKSQLNDFVNNNAELKQSQQTLSKYLQNTMDAFRLDNPQCFWLSEGKGVHFNYGFQSSGKKVTLSVTIASPAGDSGKISQINSKIASIGATGSEEQKVKIIHDYLCNNISYIDGTNAHSLYGAMVEGKAVCQGYAYAFKTACDYYGIESVCVTGDGVSNNGAEAHMWNYVKVNGVWYAVDVTWDDQASRIFTDFFLVGSNTKAQNFGNKTFAQSHIEDGKQTSASYMEFDYPTISTSAYNPQSPATPVPATPTTKPTVKPSPTATAKPVDGSANVATPTPAGNGGAVNVTPKPNDNQNNQQDNGGTANNTPTNNFIDNTQNETATPVPDTEVNEQDVTNNSGQPNNESSEEEKFPVGALIGVGAAVIIAAISIIVAVNSKKKSGASEIE